MAWFKFTLDEQNSSFLAQVSAVPGMNVRGLEVTCHDNAAWLVERIARNTGARYTPEGGHPEHGPPGWAFLVGRGLPCWGCEGASPLRAREAHDDYAGAVRQGDHGELAR